MVNGLKFIKQNNAGEIIGVVADDNTGHPFDTEDDFVKNAPYWNENGYYCYYFGDGDDGAMRTNKTTSLSMETASTSTSRSPAATRCW